MTGISQSSILRYLRNTQASVSYVKLKMVDIWADKNHVQEFMPQQFKKYYPEVIVIVDTTEFKILRPSSPAVQQLTFSLYKNCNILNA